MSDTDEQKPDSYPQLSLSDEGLLDELLSKLSSSVSSLADPYSEDGSYSTAIGALLPGLRAMAATHHLDVSLTMDDIGWHFLDFGEPGLIKHTEAGLRELGLNDMADCFVEAARIMAPLRGEIDSAEKYYEVMEARGYMERIDELTEKAAQQKPALRDSPIYAAWVKYTREHPESVFGPQ